MWLVLTFLFLMTGIVAGVRTFPFTTWERLRDGSSNIFVARCTATPKEFTVLPDGTLQMMKDGLFLSEMEVVSVLKGETNSGKTKVLSLFWPRQGEYYLIFSYSHDADSYQAVEEHRFVPLGMRFSTNESFGKTLDLQIQALLDRRLAMIKREIKDAEEEKVRLGMKLVK
jgi:hypothetical protein